MRQKKENIWLDLKLKEYAKSDAYPFHMPGHKRHRLTLPNPYQIDITEIEGFDNLHAPTGILKNAQERAAKLYGANQSYFLVNGSTCGILAALSAAVLPKGKLLMARNCHKSAYHGAYLRRLSVEYICPVMTEFGVLGSIAPEEVEKALKQNPDAAAVMITSPTYEGIVSDVSAIAEIAHRYQIPLIVDEAHGAHFGFHEAFPQSAVKLGADLVVHSIHKVLPSLTQTALLHVNSNYIMPKKVERFLNIYETSSPSYVLLSGIDRCIRLLKEEKEALFSRYVKNLSDFYQRGQHYEAFRIMQSKHLTKKEAYALDLSKIVISFSKGGMTGNLLYETLWRDYHLQMEMFSASYAVAMTSIMDTKEGFYRLHRALKDMDQTFPFLLYESKEDTQWIQSLYLPKEKRLHLHEAMERPFCSVPLTKAAGQTAAEPLVLYPPGIPILLPGEEIDENMIENIKKCLKMKWNVQGLADIRNERINVVNC